MINIEILILFFASCLGNDYHVLFITVAAPKKIPMLQYTSEYFINAYNYNHDGIVVDGMFLTKGCFDCDFPLMDEVYNDYKRARMNPISLNIPPPLYTNFSKSWIMEKYHPFFPKQYMPTLDLKLYKKNIIISHFTHYSGIYAVEMFPNADYIIFLEDDVAVYKNFFSLLKQLFDQFEDDKYSMLKIATPRDKVYSGDLGKSKNDMKKGCVWGWWGTTMTIPRFNQYIRYTTFTNYTYCGDMLTCAFGLMLDKPYQISRIMHHYGRDKKIKPKIPKYYDGTPELVIDNPHILDQY
ncbi:Uncharacterized protein QTN25_001822 [Entamoeba marina]